MSLLTQFLGNWWFLGISAENLEVEEFEEAQLGCGLELAHITVTLIFNLLFFFTFCSHFYLNLWLRTGKYHGCFDLQLLQKWYISGFPFCWVQYCICQRKYYSSPFMALNVIANLKVEVVYSEVSFCIRPDTESTHAQCVLCRRHDSVYTTKTTQCVNCGEDMI